MRIESSTSEDNGKYKFRVLFETDVDILDIYRDINTKYLISLTKNGVLIEPYRDNKKEENK